MKRLMYIFSVVLLCRFLSSCFAQPVQVDTNLKPNIVFILADDLGWGDVGWNGSSIFTPELDALKAEGVNLNNFYVYRQCVPSRVALMTGKQAWEYGMSYVPPVYETQNLPLEAETLAEHLQTSGYKTLSAGKWHLGFDNRPTAQGFDEFFGVLGGHISPNTKLRNQVYDYNYLTPASDNVVKVNGNATHHFASWAVYKIKKHDFAAQPLFMYLPFTAPHAPYRAPQAWVDLYPEKSGDDQLYSTMVSQLSHGVGRVADALKSKGVWDNTIFIFTSDNGAAITLAGSNSPYLGGKGDPYEGGHKVPFFMIYPREIQAGSSYDSPIIMHDMLPTLVTLAGATLNEPVYGQNVFQAIKTKKPLSRDLLIHASDRLLDNNKAERRIKQFALLSNNGRHKYIWRHERGVLTEELYDLGSDPYERVDISSLNSELLAQLRQVLVDQLGEDPETKFIGVSIRDKDKIEAWNANRPVTYGDLNMTRAEFDSIEPVNVTDLNP